MVVLEDAKQFFQSENCQPKIYQDTLLVKYNIPIQHLDFPYVENCNDGKELEKIVKILRSGEEGYFPDLTKAAEDRLKQIKPKSKLLTTVSPVLHKESLTKQEQNAINIDLMNWVSSVSKNDQNLNQYKNTPQYSTNLPEIREYKETTLNQPKNDNTKRIKSTDYSSWDKYDVDTEILKMELEEEKLKKSAIEHKPKNKKKTVHFKDFQTEAEAVRESYYEKEKGNEFFKVGEYEEALRHYTNSINCKINITTYTNRALTYLKLKQYKNALDDCHAALALDPHNVKGLLRRAQALNGLKQYGKALESCERAIEIDPNNGLAQELADKLRQHCGGSTILKNKRFVVEDIVENKKSYQKPKKEDKIIIPIAGPSSMQAPHFIQCENQQDVKLEMIKANTMQQQQIVHLINVEHSDDEENDCGDCLENHLIHICSNSYKNHRKLIPRKTITHCNNNNNTETVKKNCETTKIKRNEKQVIKDDKRAGGEPYKNEDDFAADMPDDIHSPFSFLKAWNSANYDTTLETHASILKTINSNRLVEVIGCKLDNNMFSTIVKCLRIHLAVADQVDRLYSILTNIVNLPRFDIIALLMSPNDKNYISVLIDFLNQHDKPLPQETVNKLLNN